MNQEFDSRMYFKTRDEWRRWLEKNHAISDGIWFTFYRKASGKPSVSYNDAVEEALCFGWIDSKVRKLDEDRYIQKFTPRRAGSGWSHANLKRVKKLKQEGKMTEAGLVKLREVEENPSLIVTPQSAIDEVETPPDLAEALAQDDEARHNFGNFAPSYRKNFIRWINDAKTKKTRNKRIDEVVRRAGENIKTIM